MLKNILDKLYSTKESPEIVLLRQKVELIAAKLEYLTAIEPKTDDDYHNIPLILEYVRMATELNLEIANIYTLEVLE